MSIDLGEQTIEASVSDLVGEPDQRAIGLGGSGLSRMWIGQELHRRIQQEMIESEDGYRPEVPLDTELSIDGWRLRIGGRADGVLFDDDIPVRVDEIKTLHFAVDLHNLYLEERLERYRRQVRLYALALAGDTLDMECRLLLVDVVSGEVQVEDVEWDADQTMSWLSRQVHRLVAVERRRLERVQRLREAAESIPFPHPEPRPVQLAIGAAVEEALGEGRHLLLRAPTGCGKTAAVLHQAMRTSLSRGQRVFFLTAKTLQQKIAVETARNMQMGLFRSLQLRAKAKMCANTEIICHEEFCPYAREYGVKLARTQLLKNLMDDDDHLDPDRIFDVAQQHEVCPFEVSLDLMPETDLVVCDYNYVFDPDIGLAAVLNKGALKDAILIIDEAHNLVDRSRGYYSPELDTDILESARLYLSSRDNSVFASLRSLVDELASTVSSVVGDALEDGATGDRPAMIPADRLADIRLAFDGALLSYFLYKRENDLWMVDDPVMQVFLTLLRFNRVLSFGGDEFVPLATRFPDGRERIKVCCLDASRLVGRTLEESAGVVAMSATLEPFDFYRNLLGFDSHRTDELSLPSPFPAENRLVMCIPDVDTTYRRRAAHYDRIAHWIGELSHPGCNVLTLFPSYRFLESVNDRLGPMSHRVLVQQPGSTDASQREILDALSNGDSHLVLAVLGGIFAEGVDYPGQMLSQVIVVSPGLPQYNTERELLKAYYQEYYGHGFGYAYLIPGLTRVVQAAGRIFRSDDDRGVIALIGQRFQDPRYARLLPAEWTDDEPESLLRESPAAEVRRFFDY